MRRRISRKFAKRIRRTLSKGRRFMRRLRRKSMYSRNGRMISV